MKFGPSWTPVGEAQEGKERVVRRRGAQIRAADVRNHGATERCPGCLEQEKGRPGITHKKECRERFEKIWKDKGDPRVEKAFERILKHEDRRMGKEEEERKRRRRGEEPEEGSAEEEQEEDEEGMHEESKKVRKETRRKREKEGKGKKKNRKETMRRRKGSGRG